MRKKIVGIILIEMLIYEVLTYQSYSRNPPGDIDFDHWTGILGTVISIGIIAFAPFLIIIFLQFFFGSGKKWIKVQIASLGVGAIILALGIIPKFF
jgi:4-amino-4-deoxy-L-arabinose transferase-like glycosyltransferase